VADIVPLHHALGGTPERRGFVDALHPAGPTAHTLVPKCCPRNALTPAPDDASEYRAE
jgi:hypothetical protein